MQQALDLEAILYQDSSRRLVEVENMGRCKRQDIPIAWNLAGGYQREPDGSIPRALEIHRSTMLAAMAVFGDQRS